MASNFTNIDFKDLFFLIWDKYSAETFIQHQDVNIDLILLAFEKAMHKLIYIVLGHDSFIFWDDEYIPVIYVIKVDENNNNMFDIKKISFNFNIKTYNFFLKLFTAELKKQILYSSTNIKLEDYPNRLIIGTFAEIKKTHSVVLLDDIYNKYNGHITG
ncbi:MAG: hypothetical protein ACP5GS_08595, partial [Nitrososphaeria archaeon]